MPNYIATILKINGETERVLAVREFIRNEETGRVIDFDKIIPMPETYKKYDTTNHPGGNGMEVGKPLDPWEKESPIVTEELVEEYKRATYDQMTTYGCVGWYDWCRRNWGTKWNACEPTEESMDTIYFETAWNFAEPVVLALSEKFPDVEFHFIYADENEGYNTGRGVAQDGEFLELVIPRGGSDEGMRNYFDTHPGREDRWSRNDNGEWEYIDD